MKINLIPAVLSCVLGLSLAACSTTKAQTTEKVTVEAANAKPAKPAFVQWDKKMVDLGKVKRGEKRTLFFEFTNVSNENIKIDIVDACDCTKVEFPRRELKPGEKGRLDVTFDSKDKEADETIGINVVFTNLTPEGFPHIEVVEYQFVLAQ